MWLILPPFGWDLPNLEALEPAPGVSQVISFVLFHLFRFGIPMHPFVGMFLRHFGLRLHDLMPHGVAHLVVFITLCECYLGIEPHFDLWRWIFRLYLNKDSNRSM